MRLHHIHKYSLTTYVFENHVKKSKQIEGQTLQCPKEKEQKDKALSTKH
jgi:hypothetical protein